MDSTTRSRISLTDYAVLSIFYPELCFMELRSYQQRNIFQVLFGCFSILTVFLGLNLLVILQILLHCILTVFDEIKRRI